MSEPTDTRNNHGPLPQQSRNSEIEQLSLRALRNALPTDKFHFRDERADDTGIDGSLELVFDSVYTNFRSQIQLKGTDSARTNADGTVSLPVDTSNLNYLLNGHSPPYILYIVPRDELRYVWAHEERKRLELVTPRWAKKATVTLHFKEVLTPSALELIFAHVKEEAQSHRATMEILGRAIPPETVSIKYDPVSLETIDPTRIERELLLTGMNTVASGQGAKVLSMLEDISPSAANSLQLLMVRSYALFTLGRYLTSLGCISDALTHDEIPPAVERYLEYIKNACELQIRRIDFEEYSAREEAITISGGGAISLLYMMARAKDTLLREPDLDKRATRLNELRNAVFAVTSDPTCATSLVLQARLTLLFAEGMGFVLTFNEDVGTTHIRRKMDLPANMQTVLQDAAERERHWEVIIQTTIEDTVALANPLIVSDALLTRASVQAIYMLGVRYATSMDPLPDAERQRWLAAMADAEQAQSTFAAAGCLEGTLRATMAIADLFEIGDQPDAAKKLAYSVLKKARAQEYRDIEIRAEQHMAGQTVTARHKSMVESRANADDDVNWAGMTDDEVLEFAKGILRSMEVAVNRLPIVQRSVLSTRDAARERLHWCRYLELHERLGHMKLPATRYRSDPMRSCTCTIHGHRSAIENPDWKAIIPVFKSTFCAKCPDRSPKKAQNQG